MQKMSGLTDNLHISKYRYVLLVLSMLVGTQDDSIQLEMVVGLVIAIGIDETGIVDVSLHLRRLR